MTTYYPTLTADEYEQATQEAFAADPIPADMPCRKPRRRRGQTKKTRKRRRRPLDRSVRCLTIVSQNVRGLAKTDKVIQGWLTGLKSNYNGRQVDAVFLQETRTHREWAAKLRVAHARSWGHEPNRADAPMSFWTKLERPAGGVAILLHPKSAITKVQPLWEDEWSSEFMALTGEHEGSAITLINIYAPSDSKDKRESLFTKLRLRAKPPGLVIVAGDFNCVLDRELDRSRPGVATAAASDTDSLQLLLEQWQLSDAATDHLLAVQSDADKRQFHADFHTFRYAHGVSDVASSRLDRIYLPTQTLSRIDRLEVTPPVWSSDHNAVWLVITEPHPPRLQRRHTGRRALRYPMLPEELKLVRAAAEKQIGELAHAIDGQQAHEEGILWDAFKEATNSETLAALRARRRRIIKGYRQRKRRLRAALRSAELDCGPVDGTVSGITQAMASLTLDRQARWRRIRQELINTNEAQAEWTRQRMFSNHAGTGADAMRALYRRLATKFTACPPARLPPDPTKPKDPAKRHAQDWREYTQRGGLDHDVQDRYFAALPTVRATIDGQPLLVPFTEEEVGEAIKACPRGKASGPDGIPNDWYRDHADLLVPVLTKLFNLWYTAGTLPASFSEATIYCIPKKPKPQTGLDYRPIALLNTDYKIFSRLLLTRTKGQLERVVSQSQFGFVPDRQVHDALDVWSAVAKLVDQRAAPSSTTAVMLDFAKAYDTLDRRFLMLTLQRLGFPAQYVRAVSAMHLATTAKYLAEGRLSDEESILNGIRQGCPLAPVLFVLAVDTLYDQLAAASSVSGVRLPTGDVVKAAGFADDTTVYLAHPKETQALRSELEFFASASGLGVNVEKCQAVAMNRSGWEPDCGDIGFPKLGLDQMARLLGSQVASVIHPAAVWDLTVKQLQTRLYLAQVKTSDVLQRAQVAQSIIVPKLLFIGRHTWPSATCIRDLQRRVHNFVWYGKFVLAATGRAWMSADAAQLPRREGGIAVPDLTAAFIQLATTAHLRWSDRARGLQSAIGAILSVDASGHPATGRPTRGTQIPPRLCRTIAATGAAIATGLSVQQRTHQELELSTALLQSVGHGTLETRWWAGGWYFTDYSSERKQLLALQQLQYDAHGSFDFHALMSARIRGDDTLCASDGRPVQWSDFKDLVKANDTIGDIIELQWVGPSTVRFRCRTIPYPLPPVAARSFRRLCDTVVYNYPAVLAPHDPIDVVRVSPATIDSWRLQHVDGGGYTLFWEPTNGIRVPLGTVHTTRDITARVRHALDDPDARAHDHQWLGPARAIWRATGPTLSRGQTKAHARAVRVQRGRRETQAKSRKLEEEDVDIGQAMTALTWAAIDQLQATTSRQRLRLRRIKGHRVNGWDRLHGKYGCPHCVDAADGGSISHIFWHCGAAQRLWTELERGWARHAIWDDSKPVTAQLKAAVFGLHIPRMPRHLWRLPDPATVAPDDAAAVARVHEAVEVAWQQQVLEVFDVIWRWRHHIENDEQQWTGAQATLYLRSVLRASTRGLLWRLQKTDELRDPRRQVLAALAAGYDDEESSAAYEEDARPDKTRHVLFFDGGSRGNPGPGGAGAVIVSMNQDGLQPKIEWSACMSYAQDNMTNNRAEYLGAIAGLTEALKRGWRVEVVGDSSLILRQLAGYRPPRNQQLRPLYSVARRLADQVGVVVWQHHLRAFNKMADAAANAAMDTQVSVQVSHPNSRPYTAALVRHLESDIQEWRAHHLLRQRD